MVRPEPMRSVKWPLLGVMLLTITGCRQDMHNQPKYIPLRSSDFFDDGRSARMPVSGTVARGQLREDTYFYTGKIGKADGDRLPLKVDRAVLQRGQQRFNIYCAPCHSPTGDGDGMIVQRGFRRPPSFHEDRLRQAAIGHYFDVMTNGFGAMPDYAVQVMPADRWAIAAYIRALQLSQNATLADVPAQERGNIKKIDMEVEKKAHRSETQQLVPQPMKNEAPATEETAPRRPDAAAQPRQEELQKGKPR